MGYLEINIRLDDGMIDDLKAMALYVQTVELGSFSAAANACNLSPSVVSYHISQLEKKYGTALLYRSTRSLSQTHEGEAFYEHAKQMAESADKAFNLLSGKSEIPMGKLSISIPAALIRSHYTTIISDFCKLYPKIEFSISYTDKRQSLVSEGIDLAIRLGKLPDSSLKVRTLGQVARKLVCTRAYAEERPLPTHPNDLASWDWIKMKMMPSYRDFEHVSLGHSRLTFAPRIEVDNVEAMHQFSMQGLGLSSPPDFIVEDDLQSGLLVEVLPEWKVFAMKVYAVWPSNAVKDGLTIRFLNFLVSNL